MNITGKKLLWILTSLLMVFVISTGVLFGITISKQRESNYHRKYIELLATVKYYDYQSENKIYSLIADLKESNYYDEGVDFDITTETGTTSREVYPSVREIERTINQVEECKGKTEWSDDEGNKLSFIIEEPEQTEEGLYARSSDGDEVVVNFGGKVITSWAGQTNVEVANILSGNAIKIQCNKDTTADNFRITSLKFESGIWYLTVEEIIFKTEINVYVLSTTFE